jgi:hypothetical protein
MGITQQKPLILAELSEFLASVPSREQFLQFRPSKDCQERAHELLEKLKRERLTREEERELDQFEFTEVLMGLVAARIRANRASKS